MKTKPEIKERWVFLLKSFSKIASVITMLVAIFVLMGWVFDIEVLKSIHPSWVSMKVNTAVCFLLAGLSLWFSQDSFQRSSRWMYWTAKSLAFVVSLVGLLTISQYLFGWDLGIDQLLYQEPAGTAATFYPGRMAPGTALIFFLCGLALLLLDTRLPGGHRPSDFLLLIAILPVLLALLGYLYGVESLYHVVSTTPVALHTAAAFLILIVGIFCARPETGLMRPVIADTSGGFMFRRIFPAIVLLPVVAGWLRLEGERIGLYSFGFGLSIMITFCIVIAGIVIWWSTLALDREDLKRRRAENEIRELNVTLERRVEERTRQLEEANKELEAFSYSVSHDLRAPLRAVSGFSSILLEEYASQLDSEARRYLGLMQTNARMMGELIDDLLAFSRLGRKQMEAFQVDMGSLAKTCAEELKSSIPERALQFEIKSLPPADGDPAMIRQVFLNLISNAIKFTKPRPTAQIEIGASGENNENIYYVKDNGVGFDMRYAEKLFGVFQRLHSASEFEGTGVGLAIVKRVVSRHQGRVWAEGKVGEGATFYFALPKTGVKSYE